MAKSKGKKKKGPRQSVKLVSSSGTVVYKKKNIRNTPGRMEIRRYDKAQRKYDVFKEQK